MSKLALLYNYGIKPCLNNVISIAIGTTFTTLGVIATVGTGGATVPVIVASLGGTCLASSVAKTIVDGQVLITNDQLKNLNDSLVELAETINKFEEALNKHTQIVDLYSKNSSEDLKIDEHTPNTNLSTFNKFNNRISCITGFVKVCIGADPTWIVESAVEAGINQHYESDVTKDIEMTGLVNKVNSLKIQLGINSRDPNEISQMSAHIQRMTNILENSKDLTQEDFRAKLSQAPVVEPTKYQEKRTMSVVGRTLFNQTSVYKDSINRKEKEAPANITKKVFWKQQVIQQSNQKSGVII